MYFQNNKENKYLNYEPNLSNWGKRVATDIPKQGNGYDCGLYTCLNMEIISRDPLNFKLKYKVSQEESERQR